MISFGQLLRPWHELPIVVIDLETTGVDPEVCMPVEVAAVRVEQGKVVESYSAFINPGVPIPDEAKAVHGISDEMVQDAGRPAVVIELALQAVGALDAIPCGYNGDSFDRAIVQRIIATTEVSGLSSHPAWPWLDPLVVVRAVDRFVRGKGRHRLSAVCERRGISVAEAHRAAGDATATAQLLFHPDIQAVLGDLTITEVLRRQRSRAAEQERDFEAWRARQPGMPA